MGGTSTAQSQEEPGTLEGLEREQAGDALSGDQLPEGASGNLESPPVAQCLTFLYFLCYF